MNLTRRSFLRTSSLALAGASFPFPGFAGTGPREDFRELRRNVGVFTHSGGTIGWLVGRDGVAVVDSQYPDPARAFLAGLPGRAGRPVDVLVNTHHHGDHTGGNAVFREETRRIVAHARARELHAAGGGADLDAALADETFGATWSVEIGDERVQARHYGPAHTGGDCTVHFERANVVHMGDLVFNRAYPFIDRPGGASVRGWVELIDSVLAEHDRDALFVFGHARPGFAVTGSHEDVRLQGDFLAALLEEADRALRQGLSREDVLRTEEIPGFPDHRPLIDRLSAGAALAAAYDELSSPSREERRPVRSPSRDIRR